MPRGIPRAGERRNRAAQRRASRPSFIDENQFYSIDEAAAFRDACRATVCAEIKSGKLKAIKAGKRTKIIGREIIRVNHLDAERERPGWSVPQKLPLPVGEKR